MKSKSKHEQLKQQSIKMKKTKHNSGSHNYCMNRTDHVHQAVPFQYYYYSGTKPTWGKV